MTDQRSDDNYRKSIVPPIDFSQLKPGVDSPYCHQCGLELRLDVRKGMWACEDASHDVIAAADWNTVLLHAAAANITLERAGIESIVYCGVGIDRVDAISPSHLLPLIVQAALEKAEAADKPQSFMLTCIPIEETQTSGSLTELMVRVAFPSALLTESLNRVASVVANASSTYRAKAPSASSMDAHYLLN